MVGNDTIMPINLQHLTPQESGHFAIVSQHECCLEVFFPWQSCMAAFAEAWAAARAEPTGASPTASAITAAITMRYMPSKPIGGYLGVARTAKSTHVAVTL